MGQWYLFKCPSCHYETECSAGPDRGMYAAVEPMICTDCKEVHNVVTGEFEKCLELLEKVKDEHFMTNVRVLKDLCKNKDSRVMEILTREE